MLLHIDVERDYYLTVDENGIYRAGCREFTKEQALEHWGPENYLKGSFTEEEMYKEAEKRGAEYCDAIIKGVELKRIPEDLEYFCFYAHMNVPENLGEHKKVLWLGICKGAEIPRGTVLPESLRAVVIYPGEKFPEGVRIPENVKRIDLYGNAILPKSTRIPKNCEIKRLR